MIAQNWGRTPTRDPCFRTPTWACSRACFSGYTKHKVFRLCVVFSQSYNIYNISFAASPELLVWLGGLQVRGRFPIFICKNQWFKSNPSREFPNRHFQGNLSCKACWAHPRTALLYVLKTKKERLVNLPNLEDPNKQKRSVNPLPPPPPFTHHAPARNHVNKKTTKQRTRRWLSDAKGWFHWFRLGMSWAISQSTPRFCATNMLPNRRPQTLRVASGCQPAKGGPRSFERPPFFRQSQNQ